MMSESRALPLSAHCQAVGGAVDQQASDGALSVGATAAAGGGAGGVLAKLATLATAGLVLACCRSCCRRRRCSAIVLAELVVGCGS